MQAVALWSGARWLRIVIVGLIVGGWLAVSMPRAHAELDGPCVGEATIDGTTYDASYDSADNPIRVPEDPGGLSIPYMGSITVDNMNYSGQVGVVIGPAVVPIATWGTEPNTDNEKLKDSVYVLGDELDNLVGIYEVKAFHKVGGTEVCTANAVIKIEGSPLGTPIGLAAVVGAVVFGILMLLGLLQNQRTGRGRPVLGGIMGLLFGLFLAIVLQQFCIRPLDNLSVVGLPLFFAVVGAALGLWGPVSFGTKVSSAKV